MKWKTKSAGALLSVLVIYCVAHADEEKNGLVNQGVAYLSQVSDTKKVINEAIKMYLEKNPPEEISKILYSTAEKAQPLSIPEAERKKTLGRLKENITPEILTKMISSGLKRNFTADEICVLSKYDESQLSDDLKKKNDNFRFEVSSAIRLLIAATSG